MGAFLLPKASSFNQNLILTPESKRILPQTTISKSQGRPKEKKIPKRLPKGFLGRVVEVTQIAFFQPWTDIGAQEPQSSIVEAFLISLKSRVHSFTLMFIDRFLFHSFLHHYTLIA